MDPLSVDLRLCLNNIAVPYVEKDFDFYDTHQVLGDAHEDRDGVPWYLVNFKGSGDAVWLEKALDLPARWWSINSKSVPLLQEILYLIGSLKSRGTAKTTEDLIRRRSNMVVGLEIRHHLILVVNDARSVTLALDVEDIEDQKSKLLWFCEELRKDIQILKSQGSSSSSKRKAEKEPLPPEFEEILQQVIEETLLKHHLVRFAIFSPGRKALIVNKKNFGIKNLKKRLSQALAKGASEWESLKSLVEDTAMKAIKHFEDLHTGQNLQDEKDEEDL